MSVREFFRRFILIYGFTMLATGLFCVLIRKQDTIEVVYFGQAALFSLCANAISLVYYSHHELSQGEWWVRTGIHTLLLEIILMVLGFWMKMWQGYVEGMVFFVIVLLVDAGVSLAEYGKNLVIAIGINKRLKERRENQG